MAGNRHRMDSLGASYEAFAHSVLGRVASLTQVETKQDFGIDTYCQPRLSDGSQTESVGELCLLQIKGGAAPLAYGGLDQNGRWKSHEIHWLRSLWAPLFLAVVDREYRAVELFSLWQVWWVNCMSAAPFQIKCSWDNAGARRDFVSAAGTISPVAEPEMGDRLSWTVPLGPPLLRLTHEALNDVAFATSAVKTLRAWIAIDRQTVARFHTGIPVFESVRAWQTNETPSELMNLAAWDPTPGRNLLGLARVTAPVVLALGLHLQHQADPDAYRLIPILQWLRCQAVGGSMLDGLLEGLERNQSGGRSPRP